MALRQAHQYPGDNRYMTKKIETVAPVPLTAQELAKQAFPENEWSQTATLIAFRETFVMGYESAAKTSEQEITELKTRLHNVLTRLDSYSWHKHDQMFVKDTRNAAIGVTL
jgi:hypothetical protein